MTDDTKQPGIRVDQVLLERASFDHRSDFLAFPPTTPVQAEVSLSLSSGLTEDGKKARVQVTVASKDDQEPLYRFSVLMTALFEVEPGAENFPLAEFVKTNAFAFVFPFAREAVANITARGRFGALWMKPVNIFALANATTQGTVTESAATENAATAVGQ